MYYSFKVGRREARHANGRRRRGAVASLPSALARAV
jgi:hypothetical protein